MSDLSDQEVYQAVGAIVSSYGLLQCDECAKAVLKWLRKNGIEGKLLRLETKFGEVFILSRRMMNQGATDSITDNGIHYGVEVRDRVFDNLATEGLSREAWLLDFRCRGGQFVVKELDKF